MVIRPSASGRNWNALSESYRDRLERHGISRRDYERGASVQAARGHAATPERPSQASPERHGAYLSRREAAIDRIQAVKVNRYGDRPSFNRDRSRKAIDTHDSTGDKRSVRDLERLAAMYDAAEEDDLEGEEWYADLGDDSDADHYH